MKQIILAILFSLLYSPITNAQSEAPDYANNTYNVTARDDASALWYAIGEENLDKIVSLRVTGTINGWDIMVLNNKLPNLRYIDLSDATIINGTYEIHQGVATKDNEIPNGAFSKHPAIEIKLPKNITNIGSSAFYGCPNLKDITIPTSVDSIGTNAFYTCPLLSNVRVEGRIRRVCESAFEGSGIKSIVFHKSVKTLDYKAFNECKNLENVHFEEDVDTIGESSFANCTKLYDVKFSGGLKYIGRAGFYACTSLSSILLPEGIRRISDITFAESGLTSFVIPSSVTSIGDDAFRNTELTSITIPEAVKSIYWRVFSKCYNLETVIWNAKDAEFAYYSDSPFSSCPIKSISFGQNVRYIPAGLLSKNGDKVKTVSIPSSVRSIGFQAFYSCNLSDIYVYTIEPTNISENTFSTYKTATLHVPKAAYYNYYWAVFWNKFQNIVAEDGVEYDQFYINNDYNTNENTGTVNGTPNVEMGPESGWTVGTDEKQNVDTVFAQIIGDKGSSIITNGDNFHANRVDVSIKLNKGQWHFFCFPFDVDITENIEYDGDLAICEYDGEVRAEQGSNGWKFVEGNKLQKFKGYIIQGSEGGDMHVKYDDVAFADKDENLSLQFYGGKTPSDDGWNLIGNPYLSYYSIKDLVFDAPVLVWDRTNMTYTAYRGKDDEYRIAPFEGFFVQASKTGQYVGFLKDYRQTYQNKDNVGNKSAIVSARNDSRNLIDIELTDGDRTDKTRIVFNDGANSGYEPGVDMEKMMSQDLATPQIYTIDNNSEYAINERPMGDGSVSIGAKVAKQGTYTFSASRVEGPAVLTDNVTGMSVDLAESSYEVALGAGEYTTRFTLNKNGIVTGVEEISSINADEVVDIYDVAGRLMKKDATSNEAYSLPNGVYILKGVSGVHKVAVK